MSLHLHADSIGMGVGGWPGNVSMGFCLKKRQFGVLEGKSSEIPKEETLLTYRRCSKKSQQETFKNKRQQTKYSKKANNPTSATQRVPISRLQLHLP